MHWAPVDDLDFEWDRRLVERARDGDAEAARQIVERHQARVYRLAYRLVGDAEVAQDLAQDTFLRVLRRLHRIEDGTALTSFLTRTATNLARDHWRRRRDTVEFDEGDHGDVDGPDPARDAASAQIGERVQRALMAMPHLYREAFVLRHVQELSHEEMCAQLGIGLSAVKVRIHRACRMLRDLLPEYGGE